MTSTTSAILDHAGATYWWFASVTLKGKNIEIVMDEDYLAEVGDETLRTSATLTTADIRKAAEKLRDENPADTYEGRFYRDILARNWDDADGDMNAVDALLQTAMWGEPIFG